MRYYRRVIRIRAEDSPNVKRGLAQVAAGIEPDDMLVVPGVITYSLYKKRRQEWDEQRQAVGLDGQFYYGPELKLFPPTWLTRAASDELVRRCRASPAEGIGVDPGEGGANTCWAAVNRYGLKTLLSKKTPDTSVIPGDTLAFMRAHNIPPDRVCFDRGGGGKQHADKLRAQGFNVRTIAFGEKIIIEPRRGMKRFEERKEQYEDKYVYKNRRAEMYGEASELCNPSNEGFAIPLDGPSYSELHRQLKLIPKLYDNEGRMILPPKTLNPGQETSQIKTLIEIIGNSPDEADALVLAIHAMLHRMKPATAGVN